MTDDPNTTKRERRLKVYGGNLDGVHRAIMACHSFKEFRAATRISPDYGCETGNPDEIAQAMTEPGAVFKRADARFPLPEWTVHRKRSAESE